MEFETCRKVILSSKSPTNNIDQNILNNKIIRIINFTVVLPESQGERQILGFVFTGEVFTHFSYKAKGSISLAPQCFRIKYLQTLKTPSLTPSSKSGYHQFSNPDIYIYF